MMKRTRSRIGSIFMMVFLIIVFYFLVAIFQGMFTDFSGEEKAEIRQMLINYEYYNFDEEDLNLMSDLDIHIEKYTDGSYLVSKDGHTLLYDSVDDTYPDHNYPLISYQLKSNFKYLIIGILILLAGWIGFELGREYCYEYFDDEGDDDYDGDYDKDEREEKFEEVEPEENRQSKNQEK